jgi:hypothetical protein
VHVILAANLSGRPEAGGHHCALGQWAQGLRRAGHEVTVLDTCDAEAARAARGLVCDVLLNVMGAIAPEDRPVAGRRVFVDIDPGYPQMWEQLGLADVLRGHDQFVTIAENIGAADCLIPTCGLDWVTTPPCVALDDWPVAKARGSGFTTVATWRNPYGTVEYDGVTYGSRVHEFRKFLELPRLVGARFELALDIDAAEVADLRALERNGWQLVDPRAVAATAGAYQSFIQGSGAEFCVAQNMYVATRSGWLSDRSLCYLASGRPVLAQDTGFTDHYPVGEGLIAFSTLDQAAAGVDEIERNYEHHSQAARALAEEYFDAAGVLGALIERLARAPVAVGR